MVTKKEIVISKSAVMFNWAFKQQIQFLCRFKKNKEKSIPTFLINYFIYFIFNFSLFHEKRNNSAQWQNSQQILVLGIIVQYMFDRTHKCIFKNFFSLKTMLGKRY